VLFRSSEAAAIDAASAPVLAVEAEVSRPRRVTPGESVVPMGPLSTTEDSGSALSGGPDEVRAGGRGGHARPRVLVIDDEPAVGKVLARMLRSECDVVVLTDGEDALRRVSGGERFGAIVTDVMMPVLTGIELREQLRAIDPEQARRIVFITGGVFNSAVAELLEQPDIRCMTKPVDADALRRAVSEVAGLSPTAGSGASSAVSSAG
jgi:CheY-like chemotaxis protein